MNPFGRITPIAGALGDALDQFGLRQRVKERELFVRWKELVGKALANHCEPARFREGTLWIHVENAAWRQELSLMRRELQRKLNDALGEELIRDIVLR